MHAVQRMAEGVAAFVSREDAASVVRAFDEQLEGLALDLTRISNAESALQTGSAALERVAVGGTSWRELFARHVMACVRENQGDAVAASKEQTEALNAFERLFRDDGALWLVPLLFALTRKLHARAKRADAALRKRGAKAVQQEEAARVLNNLFRACMMDRAPWEQSKKRSAVRLSNVLFNIYFDLNTLGLCKNLVSIVEGPGFGALSAFPAAQVVTYKYYVGKLDLFQGDTRKSQAALRYAFTRVPARSIRNRRLVLTYLVPVELLLGRVPRPALLSRYALAPLSALVSAFCLGDLAAFNAALRIHEKWLIARGIYLILEQLRPLVFRNLLKRIHVLLDKPEQLKLETVRAVVAALTGEEVDLDAIECQVANLIYLGHVKGYLSHKHRIAVLSKANAFPKLTSK